MENIITVPKNFKLYHQRSNPFDINKYDELFCSFSCDWWESEKIYELKIMKNLECLFMVSDIDGRMCKSSITKV